MAPRRLRDSNSVLVAVRQGKAGYLVFRFDVRRLFTDDDDDHRPREVLPLPRSPVASFWRTLRLMGLVVSPGPGREKIVAITDEGDTMIYDAIKSQYTSGPSLRATKYWPILLVASEIEKRRRRRRGDMLMFAATREPDYDEAAGPHFEVLRLEAGRLQLLPAPAPLFDSLPVSRGVYGGYAHTVTCYFVAGGRVWLSLRREGTYSLDMRRPTASWRREGRWVLPLQGRAVYAPDLGLLFGFREGRLFLCAVDIRARPPVIRQEWRSYYGLVPSKQEGYSYDLDTRFLFTSAGLAYLGGGRFCISWYSNYPWRADGRTLFALTAVEVTRDGEQLLLRKRRSRCYLLDRYQSMGIQGALELL